MSVTLEQVKNSWDNVRKQQVGSQDVYDCISDEDEGTRVQGSEMLDRYWLIPDPVNGHTVPFFIAASGRDVPSEVYDMFDKHPEFEDTYNLYMGQEATVVASEMGYNIFILDYDPEGDGDPVRIDISGVL